jgi:hypothetical protein
MNTGMKQDRVSTLALLYVKLPVLYQVILQYPALPAGMVSIATGRPGGRGTGAVSFRSRLHCTLLQHRHEVGETSTPRNDVSTGTRDASVKCEDEEEMCLREGVHQKVMVSKLWSAKS